MKSRRNRRDTQRASAPNPWGTGSAATEVKKYVASVTNQQLYHDLPTLVLNTDVLANLARGTDYWNRVGYKIFVKNLEIKMLMNNKDTRPNVTYRILVIASQNSTQADTFTELTTPTGFLAQHLPFTSQCLHDQMLPLNQGATMTTPTKERSFAFQLNIPINKAVVYNKDDTCATRIAIYCLAYDAHATLTTDNIASIPRATVGVEFTDA